MTPIEAMARAIATSAHGDDEGWAAWTEEADAALKAIRRVIAESGSLAGALNLIDAAITEQEHKS